MFKELSPRKDLCDDRVLNYHPESKKTQVSETGLGLILTLIFFYHPESEKTQVDKQSMPKTL